MKKHKDLPLTKKRHTSLVEAFKQKVLEKHRKEVSMIILFGSSLKNVKTANDIDIIVVVDDMNHTPETCCGNDVLPGLKEIAKDISDLIIVQNPVTLTNFWAAYMKGIPVTLNIVRHGKILYGNRFMLSLMKKLLSEECVERSMEIIRSYKRAYKKRISRIQNTRKVMLFDCYQIMLESTRAVLMAAGNDTPAPKETSEALEPVLRVQKIKNTSTLIDQFNRMIDIKTMLTEDEFELKAGTLHQWINITQSFGEEMEGLTDKIIEERMC